MVLSLILNCVIVIVTTAINVWYMMPKHTEADAYRAQIYRYYTTDSNILAAFGALSLIYYEVMELSVGMQMLLPMWAVLLKYAGTVAVMVTFLTCIFFLGPTMGYKELFIRDGFYMHLVGPMLALVSFVFAESSMKLPFPLWFVGAASVPIYGVIYLIMAVFKGENKGGWPDFYGFNRNGMWKVSLPVMILASILISFAIAAAHNAFVK